MPLRGEASERPEPANGRAESHNGRAESHNGRAESHNGRAESHNGRSEPPGLPRGSGLLLNPAGRAENAPLEAEAENQQTHSRMDAFSGRWTLFAAQRSARPNEYVVSASPSASSEGCPFCAGNEQATPEPILVVDAEDAIGDGLDRPGGFRGHRPVSGRSNRKVVQQTRPWGIRVVPNKFPAVDPLPPELDRQEFGPFEGTAAANGSRRPASPRTGESPETPLFASRRACGAHEVFIESPEHCKSLADLDLAHVATLLGVYQSRLAHWRSQHGIQYLSLFKNVGPSAGASLHHPHSQLIALSELPRSAKRVAERMQVHHAHTGCCLQCDMLRAELKAQRRVVAVTDSLVAYCPFASHLPMLLRITTRRHVDQFERLNGQEIDELARLIRRSIRWLRALYPDAAYNFLIHTRPPGAPGADSYHWSFELFPRLTHTAGFEWSCDCMINPTLPEDAAEQLHNVAVQENPLRA